MLVSSKQKLNIYLSTKVIYYAFKSVMCKYRQIENVNSEFIEKLFQV